MSTREPGIPVSTTIEFSNPEALVVSKELQRLAFLLALKDEPSASSEHTDLVLPDKSHISTMISATSGKAPNRIVEIQQPRIPAASWQPSGRGILWKNTRTHGYVNKTTYAHTIRSIMNASGLYRDDLLNAPADVAFDILGVWARQHAGVRFATEAIYEDDSGKDIACQFITGTITTFDEAIVTHELEITDSQRIGKAVVDRTISIGATQVSWYDETILGEHDTLHAHASVSLQSDDLPPEELAAATQEVNLDSGVICDYVQSSQNRFNAPNTSA